MSGAHTVGPRDYRCLVDAVVLLLDLLTVPQQKHTYMFVWNCSINVQFNGKMYNMVGRTQCYEI